jgi:hypothetical protein
MPLAPRRLPSDAVAAWPRRVRIAVACAATLLPTAGALRAQAARPAEPRFPTLRSTALSGREYALPRDFEGRANVVFVAFRREQQRDVDGWLPSTRQLAAARPGVRFYELPTLRRGYRLLRPVIDGGMRGGIPDPATRDLTITLYTDVAAFRDSLGLPSDRSIYTLLVDSAGVVRWRGDGPYTAELGASLAEAVARVLDAPAR